MRPVTARMCTVALALAAAMPSTSHAEIDAQGSPDSIELRGSSGMLLLAQHVSEAYMTTHPEATIVISAGSSHRGLKALILGISEVAMSTDTLPEPLAKLAASRKVELEKPTVVYYDAVVPIVNPKNSVGNLTRKQLRDVFRGAIANWKDVGGKDAPIVLATHVSTSSNYETLKRDVLGDDAVVAPSAKVVSNAEMRKLVGGDENAIGYTNAHDVGSLKPLMVDGVEASAATVRSEAYPLRRRMCLWTRKPVAPMAQHVIDAFLSADGQDFVRSLGDVPVK